MVSAIVGEGSKLDWYEGVEVVSHNAREGKWHNCSTIEDHNPLFSAVALNCSGSIRWIIIFLRGFKELFLAAWKKVRNQNDSSLPGMSVFYFAKEHVFLTPCFLSQISPA